MVIPWRKYIAEINKYASSYLLCVSGGVDSMFMLDFFHRNCKKPFRVAHFNHGLRETAERDQAFVESVCYKLGVECFVGFGDSDKMRKATSLEAEARDQRYAYYDTIRLETDMLVTGHHANDQVETVIMRLMRGYPDDKLRMKKIDEIRCKPFLDIPKDVIVERAKHLGLTWVEDETNNDTVHERNWVRHVLVPQMMERRNIVQTIGIKNKD
jgi:tRNA(Ile)-lysidine synthase